MRMFDPPDSCAQEVFENHRVVFTVGTSIASVLTAWAGKPQLSAFSSFVQYLVTSYAAFGFRVYLSI